MSKYIPFIITALLFAADGADAQTGYHAVTNFGTNPGTLNMYSYVPAGITGKAPLVLAMHGCGENAALYATQTGWDKLADDHGFYVVYPEQNLINNPQGCFNWFVPTDASRGQGEALSIKQMVDYMEAHYNIDSSRIFVTGLSAGGCMTTVMLACYPDVFNAGAVMAGVPYKAATTVSEATSVLLGQQIQTPQVWGDLVRGAFPSYTGNYPRVAVFQGTADAVCNQQNATEVMKQWTNLDSAGQTPVVVNNPFNSNAVVSQSIYNNPAGTPVVETFFISGMPHGIALDTGRCFEQGGTAGLYAWNVHLYSSFWAGYFWGIMGNDGITITGLQSVVINQNNVVYSVPGTTGVTYTWTVPMGATIVSGQGTHQITVNFTTYSGNITVTETANGACEAGPANLMVHVHVASCAATYGNVSAAFCAGTSYNYNNRNYPVAGTYTDTLVNTAGCDSIVTLQLSVNTAPVASLSWDSMFAQHLFYSLGNGTQPDTGICNDYAPFYVKLTGGQPAGGVYSGRGVTHDTLWLTGINGLDTISYTCTNNHGCTASASDIAIIDVCYGINTLALNTRLQIYPNPTTGKFSIETNNTKTQTVQVFDAMGKLVLTQLLTGTGNIDASRLSDGVYIISVTCEGEGVKKLIVINR